ncbi:MAG: B12-binding domain-containing radical SAM protein [Clostridia bacterium]|nr:B12-binding domain-containing radical SAM protein [Clostridia bacterium]
MVEGISKSLDGSKPEDSIRGKIMFIYMQRLGTGNLYQLTEPLGLKALAAFVEDKGYNAKVFSGPAHIALSVVDQEISEYGLDVVGLYCDYENCSVVESFCRTVKNKWGTKVFIGGPQAVALGDSFLKNSCCDVLIRGEGEYPVYELLEFFLHGCGSLETIAGVSYLDKDNHLISLKPRPPINDLDGLPFRKPGKDWTSYKNRKSFTLLTGRGCPFNCAFCYEGSVPGKVRLRSVDNVISELRCALEHNPGIRYIWFADDTFTLDPKRIEAFSREFANLRREYDFVWFCECHPSTFIRWPDMLSAMLESGLVRMQIGIESGSPRVIELYRKQATLEQIEDVVQQCWKKGLPQLAGNIIIGGALETRQTFDETKKFVARLLDIGPGMVDITSTFFLPLPNTALTCNPSAFGLNIIDIDSLTSSGDIAVAETRDLSREEITSMRMEFTNHILTKMLNLQEEGHISEARILEDFRLKHKYGIESNWYKMVYSPDNILKNYYTLMEQGSIVNSKLIPGSEIWNHCPIRTFRLWEYCDFDSGNPIIARQKLSWLEFELILSCTGTTTLNKICMCLYSNFKNDFSCYEDFCTAVLGIMSRFEGRRWLGYTEY